MAESDWDTVTVLRKKGPTAAQAKSKQVWRRAGLGTQGRPGDAGRGGGCEQGLGAGRGRGPRWGLELGLGGAGAGGPARGLGEGMAPGVGDRRPGQRKWPGGDSVRQR